MSLIPVDPPQYRLVKQTPCGCGSEWCSPVDEELDSGTLVDMKRMQKKTPGTVIQQLLKWDYTPTEWRNL